MQRCPQTEKSVGFNRRYYDDVIRSDAHGKLDPETRTKLYGQIGNFERMLADQDIPIVKLFLHISKDEQRVRPQERKGCGDASASIVIRETLEEMNPQFQNS